MEWHRGGHDWKHEEQIWIYAMCGTNGLHFEGEVIIYLQVKTGNGITGYSRQQEYDETDREK